MKLAYVSVLVEPGTYYLFYALFQSGLHMYHSAMLTVHVATASSLHSDLDLLKCKIDSEILNSPV